MQDQSLQTDDPTVLLTLLNLPGESPQLWQPQELAAILRHELNAPLCLAVGKYCGEAEKALGQFSAGSTAPRNVQELLCLSHPPPELLRVVKRFAKSCSDGSELGLPREIALLLYYTSIAVARLKCQTRLSELPDDALKSGLEWIHCQNWVDRPLQGLVDEALASF